LRLYKKNAILLSSSKIWHKDIQNRFPYKNFNYFSNMQKVWS